MATIAIDITGFYYHIDVPFDDRTDRTVLDVMKKAKGQRSPNGGVLEYKLDRNDKFLSWISVDFDSASNPRSRQEGGSSLPPERPKTLYKFVDDVNDPKNRIENGGVGGLLAWQFYVFSKDMKLKSRFGPNGERGIVPLSTSNAGPYAVELADGDTIIWRTVGIFGINQFFDANRELLISRSGGQPLSFKAAASILKSANVDMSDMSIR